MVEQHDWIMRSSILAYIALALQSKVLVATAWPKFTVCVLAPETRLGSKVRSFAAATGLRDSTFDLALRWSMTMNMLHSE